MGEVICNCCGEKRDWPILVLYTDSGFTLCERCVEAAVARLDDIKRNELPKEQT